MSKSTNCKAKTANAEKITAKPYIQNGMEMAICAEWATEAAIPLINKEITGKPTSIKTTPTSITLIVIILVVFV